MGYIRTYLKKKQEQLNRSKVARRPIKKATPEQEKGIQKMLNMRKSLDKIREMNKKKLQEHAKHHSVKHITEMRKLMRSGKTFTQAHNIVQKKIGK